MEKLMKFDSYIEHMKNGIVHPLIKIEMLRYEDESVYSSFVCKPLSGSITVNAISGGARRSCNVVLPNFNKQYIPNSNDLNKLWINTKFLLYAGIIDDITKESIFFPQGEFTLFNSDPEIISDYSSKFVNLKADDKWSILDIPIGYIYQVDPNTKVGDVVRSIIQLCGDKKEPIIEDLSDVSPYTLRWSSTDTFGKILKDLADLYSREVFYNSTGQLVFQSFKDSSILNNAWEFTTDEVQYEGSSRVYKFSEIINNVVVIGGTVDSQTFRAEVKNTDLTSNTRIDLIGTKSKVIQDEKIYSDDLCQQRANMELEKRKRMQELISLKSSPLFHFDVNEGITIIDHSINLHKDKYSVQEFQLDITGKSPMSIQAYKYNDVSEYEDLGIPT